ncbi:hypothetical protein [Spiroplasma culicicola]|uniref:EF-hand domain-containing protein n=1 Tax=Spiroplasma culicicola AES-1 TaxID=1276246 RepID=W6AH16_9MOLU|nr:hypothetical protein [Spiroplasma culicicola]AHI52984.1 hypothetical protein SCULI_v1c06430 [Spiroplasma culicicola AES-1]
MYYVMCKNNDFFVMDKDMNVVAHFVTFEEAQRASMQLNYQAKIQETINGRSNDLLNINNYRANSLKESLPQMLGQGQVSYGNITINIPGSSQTREKTQVKHNHSDQQALIVNKPVVKRKPVVNPTKESKGIDNNNLIVNDNAVVYESDKDKDSFISTGEINNFLQKLEE